MTRHDEGRPSKKIFRGSSLRSRKRSTPNQRDIASFDQLLAGELDLAVRSREALPHGLRFEPLFASDRTLIVPRGHLRNPSLAMRS